MTKNVEKQEPGNVENPVENVEKSAGTRRYEVAKGVFVTVSEVHRFGTDAVLLADFACPKKSDIACDLGTGCGIIPLLWCRNEYPKSITAVDIQADACELLKSSAAASGLEGRIVTVCADLREMAVNGGGGKYTLVTMNPPYKPEGTGIKSASEGEKLTRHETACTLDDASRAAARLLNFAGRFCICHRPERLCDIITSMRGAGIEPKRIRFVSQRSELEPWLVLVEGKKGAKPSVRVMPGLIIEDENGKPSDELEQIYSFYREMRK